MKIIENTINDTEFIKDEEILKHPILLKAKKLGNELADFLNDYSQVSDSKLSNYFNEYELGYIAEASDMLKDFSSLKYIDELN